MHSVHYTINIIDRYLVVATRWRKFMQKKTQCRTRKKKQGSCCRLVFLVWKRVRFPRHSSSSNFSMSTVESIILLWFSAWCLSDWSLFYLASCASYARAHCCACCIPGTGYVATQHLCGVALWPHNLYNISSITRINNNNRIEESVRALVNVSLWWMSTGRKNGFLLWRTHTRTLLHSTVITTLCPDYY